MGLSSPSFYLTSSLPITNLLTEAHTQSQNTLIVGTSSRMVRGTDPMLDSDSMAGQQPRG